MRISPQDLTLGQKFYECYSGKCLLMEVTTLVDFDGERWVWKAKDVSGRETDYVLTKGFESYGPQIYSEPAYV